MVDSIHGGWQFLPDPATPSRAKNAFPETFGDDDGLGADPGPEVPDRPARGATTS
jgi:hypothetical protein